MTIGGMANVDRALLQSEWTLAHDETPECYCVSCGGVRSCTDVRYHDHEQDCPHDLALCERGYPDQVSRDRARELLKQASATTLFPPEPVPPTPRNTGTP